MNYRNVDIAVYDDKIYGLKMFLEHGHTNSYSMEKIRELVRGEMERLTAERNNLIRLGG